MKSADQLPAGSAVARFNAALAVKITNGVGSMWCAYAFAAIALVSLPQAISSHNAVTLVSWISQTFLQLVLLSIVIVGQNVLATASDRRAESTFVNAEAVLHEARQIQQHLRDQDTALADIVERFGAQAG
jgi:DNA integrity scanning protein DisA with diadenylate cyclase activity